MQRIVDILALFVLAVIGLPILVDSAIKGVAVLAAIGLAVLGMRRCSAATRHVAWTAGMAGLLVLPVLSAVLPQWRILPPWMDIAVEQRSGPVGTAAPEAFDSVSPVPVPAETAATAVRIEPLPASTAEAGTVPAALGTELAKPGTVEESEISLSNWAVVIWLGGVGLLFLRLFVCQGGLVYLKLKSRRLDDGALADLMHSLSMRLRISRPVTLLLSDRRTIPMTWGIVRPHVLLPSEALVWPADRQKAVLLHELAHVRRRDCLTQLLIQLSCALHWFNPLVWLAAWRIAVERERACDDVVLWCGFAAPDYAEHVLNIGSTLKGSFTANTASVAMARPHGLENRLHTILDATLNRAKPRRSILVLSLLAFAAALLPISMMQAVQGVGDDDSQPSHTVPQTNANSLAPVAETEFGPIIELLVHNDAGEKPLVDFDRAKTGGFPDSIKQQEFTEENAIAWMTQSGFDAIGERLQESKKAHLPNAEGGPKAKVEDFVGVKFILDLASGEMLAFPDDAFRDPDQPGQLFADLKQGDVLYAGHSLFCLRGARAMQWDGNSFTPMEPGDFAPSSKPPRDLVRYELTKFPCRLLITTAEEEEFDVTVLAQTKDGGVDVKYGRFVPDVRPDDSPDDGGSALLKHPRVDGQLEASERTTLYPLTTGDVQKVHVNLGDQVSKDQLLATLAGANLGGNTSSEHTDVRAPFDGIIAQRHIDPGKPVQLSKDTSTPLFEIVRVDPIRVVAHIPAPYSKAVKARVVKKLNWGVSWSRIWAFACSAREEFSRDLPEQLPNTPLPFSTRRFFDFTKQARNDVWQRS